MKYTTVVVHAVWVALAAGCGGSPNNAGSDVAADVDGVAAADVDGDADGQGADADAAHGGFFLVGKVTAPGADSVGVAFVVHDDLGVEVPVFVHQPGPDYRLEVPALPDFERNYRVTFSLAGYVSVVSSGVYRPGFSDSLVSDTAGVALAALNRGLPVAVAQPRDAIGHPTLSGVFAVSPTDGTLLVPGPEHYRLVRRGPGGLTVTELPDLPLSSSWGGFCVRGQGTSPVAFTPDGALAFVGLPAGPNGFENAVVDLVHARVVTRLPYGNAAVSARGTLHGRDSGILVPSLGGDFALYPLEYGHALFLTWAGGELQQTPLPVESDGFTRDGAWLVSLTLSVDEQDVAAYERATGSLVPFGTTNLGGPPQLGVDASFMLIADQAAPHHSRGGACWQDFLNGCDLRVVFRDDAEPAFTLATGTLRYAVSSTKKAVMYQTVDAVVHHDLDTGLETRFPQTVAFPGTEQYALVSSLVTDDRMTVADDDGATVFDLATGAIVVEIPGVWAAVTAVAGDTVALVGRCRAYSGDTDCRRALVDTRSGLVTLLPATASDGFYASGARRFSYPSLDGLPVVKVGGTGDPNERWDELAVGNGTEGVCGFEWPASHHAPCVLYIRPQLGFVEVAGVRFDTLCFE